MRPRVGVEVRTNIGQGKAGLDISRRTSHATKKRLEGRLVVGLTIPSSGFIRFWVKTKDPESWKSPISSQKKGKSFCCESSIKFRDERR